jgi:two-component system invasion response regulator UvrY
MIKAILADDHEVVRRGIKQVLEEKGEIKIIGEVTDGSQAIEQFEALQPDLIIMDISMPNVDGLEASKQILLKYPSAKILMLTMHSEEQYAVRTLRAGALGYITKNSKSEELYKAVKTVSQGQRYVSDQGKESIVTQLLNSRNNAGLLCKLSDRELQVLRLIAKGKKTRDIGDSLNLGIKTVETYRGRLMTKLNLHTIAELVLFAHENKLI